MSIRYKITFAYDGTRFYGFEKQPGLRTVEGTLNEIVNKMAKNPDPPLKIYGSGRTDAGVHALAQVAHFDFPFDIPVDGMWRGLNSMMPLDIEVKKVEKVPHTFHARYDVSGKIYVYRAYLGHFTDPFKRFYTGHWRYPVNFKKVKEALKDLIGTHDFTSFCASGAQVRNHVRTIYDATCRYDHHENELVFKFYGNGFLYNMVRIIVGVLLEIGSNRRPVHDIKRLYQVKDRNQAVFTAPASGLYLKKVIYKGEDPRHPTKFPEDKGNKAKSH